jgi:CPA1 family monovalent cation:H+ antiporter
MLSFLLFAGALHINLEDLLKLKWVIASLASVGVVLSTLMVGSAVWLLLELIGASIPYLYCLLFGALISPTDPIAVAATLKTVGVSRSLETKIAGESLFNDGVGVVVFLVLAGMVTNPESVSLTGTLKLFLQETVGGALLGLSLGYFGYRLLRTIDNYQTEILITLAVALGGYMLALELHVSGPICVVIAGLLIGNRGRTLAMSDKTKEHIDAFWELIDETLNMVLFTLIGLELLTLDFSLTALVLGLVAIPIVLFSRLFSVGLPVLLLRLRHSFSPNVVKILVWGGIRGGISIALALSLPAGAERSILVMATYVVVIFSISVQGLSLGPLLKRLDQE